MAEYEPFADGEVQNGTDGDGNGIRHYEMFHVQAAYQQPHHAEIPEDRERAVSQVERSRRIRRSRRPPGRYFSLTRSRQVNRSCHTKLCRTAISTAAATAAR